jgi:hypothetical protein
MALLKLGPMAAAISGTIGGTVFARNRGGAYARAWAKPRTVISAQAIEAKYILGLCSQGWAALTEAQKDAWRSWTVENPSTNRLGESRTLSGPQAFNALNARVYRCTGGLLSMPPLTNPPAAPVYTSLTCDISDSKAEIVFTPTPIGAGKQLWVWGCLVGSSGISYIKNRTRLIYNADAAETSPLDIWDYLVTRWGTPQAGEVLYAGIQHVDKTSGLASPVIYMAATFTT